MLTINVKVNEKERAIKLSTIIRFHGTRTMVLGGSDELVIEGESIDNLYRSKNGELGTVTVYKSPRAHTSQAELEAENIKFKRMAEYYQKLSDKYGTTSNTGIDRELGGDVIIDKTWIKSRFMVPKLSLHPIDAMNADVSIGSFKYTNTSIGNSLACNPRPQFCKYADIKLRSVSPAVVDRVQSVGEAPNGHTGDYTMGRYYSEAIDDNSMLVFLQFGVPKFNNLLMFLMRSVSFEDTYIANHGRIPVGYKIGYWAGNFFRFCAFPLMSLVIFGAKSLLELFLGGMFSYYYMEPAMPHYWSTVTQLVNQLATDLGMLPAFLQKDEAGANANAGKMGTPAAISRQHMEDMAKIFPAFYHSNTGYIDVPAIALSAQDRMSAIMKGEIEHWNDRENMSPKEKNDSFKGYLNRAVENLDMLINEKGEYLGPKDTSRGADRGVISHIDGFLTFGSYIKSLETQSYLKEEYSTYVGDNGKEQQDKKEAANKDHKQLQDTAKQLQNNEDMINTAFKRGEDGRYTSQAIMSISDDEQTWFNKYARFFSAAARDGAGYAVFRVDYIGSVSDSWSNSTGDIETEGLIKSAAQGARNVAFNLGGGNILPGMNDLITTVNNVVVGFLDGVTFNLASSIAAVLNGAFVQLPKKWEDSDFSPSNSSYSFTLISPYGNIYSQMQNIYIPLCMMLAGACPQSVGKSSYASPFLCSLFNKGVQNIRMGMITSLSITRGTSNLGFNRLRRPLAIEVSFTVTDFNIMPASPVNASIFSFKDFNLELDDQMPMSIYLSTLASRDLYTQKYMMPKIKLKIARIATSVHRMVSPSTTAMWAGSSPLAQNTFGLFGQHRVLNVSLLNPNT